MKTPQLGSAIIPIPGVSATITYDPTTSGLTATDVQDAIDELQAEIRASGNGNVYTDHVQSPQSLRYLMRDGTFRNPLLVGSGSVSVGSPSTLVNTSDYNAWPVNCLLRGGYKLKAWTRGSEHHGSNTGRALGLIQAPDGTHGSEFTIYDDASLWVTVMGVSQMPTGRVLAVLFRDNAGSPGTGEAGFVSCDDIDAATPTWSTWQALPNAFTAEAFGAGPFIALPNGEWVVPIEGRDSGDGDLEHSSHLLRTNDEGATFTEEVIRDFATDSRPYYESKLLLLDDETTMALHRTSAGTGTHYVQFGSRTATGWSAPAAAFDGCGSPNCIQASTGTIFAGTRKNSNSAAAFAASTDRGATWATVTELDATMYESEYACPVEDEDGRILWDYGYQVTSSITNSDIKEVYTTESTTPITASITVKDEGTPLATGATSLDFVGAGVTASGTGAGKTITIPGATISGGTDHEHIDNLVFSGDGSTSVFELPAAPFDANSISVYVATARSQDWTLSGALLTTLTFGSAPASAADNIVIDLIAAVA